MKATRLICIFICMLFAYAGNSQRYLSDLDSSLLYLKDSVKPFLKRFDNLRFTGYIQPQFQVASVAGARSYNGGDFSPFSKTRFMLRRARIKIDYIVPTEDRRPLALFTFQIDATERGVNVRDMFLKLYESKKQVFSLTAGLFARPYGYEVNLSSSYRETPERGRMSQILMPSERDLGVMVTYEPRSQSRLNFLKWDAGIFNGQGVVGPTDFDSYKDIISRITFKPRNHGSTELSGGLSILYGGWRQGSRYLYETGTNTSGDVVFVVDSSISNIGDKALRFYYGADMQVLKKHHWGKTEIRAEYWRGTQPGTEFTTSNPGTLPIVNGQPAPLYSRKFDGAFLLLLQDIVNEKNQLMVKYDWYDPNTAVEEQEIGKSGTNLTAADIRYNTWGFGYARYINSNLKLLFYYDLVMNEKTQMSGFTSDSKDNIFTTRLQLRF